MDKMLKYSSEIFYCQALITLATLITKVINSHLYCLLKKHFYFHYPFYWFPLFGLITSKSVSGDGDLDLSAFEYIA